MVSLDSTFIDVLMLGFSSIKLAIILWPKYFAVETIPTLTDPL